MSTSPQDKVYDPAKILRRALFFVLLAGLAIVSLFLTFNGLSAPRGMEQAQIGREIARGNGYSTKVLRPMAMAQMKEANGQYPVCLLYTSPSPRDQRGSRMPSSA